MKPFIAIVIAGLFAGSLSAQTAGTSVPANTSSLPTSTTNSAVAVFGLKETSFDFGKIPQSRPVTHVFEFTNNGKEPLKIENVQAACGCTTPEWSKEPVAPGASSSIKVGYNAAAEGQFSKTVTVSFNGNQMKTIVITGNVYKTPATSAPVNASVNLLKQSNQ